ncbi:hypothetical protein PF005_g10175 [Phytophthora fragariae]|uniref:Tyrosinase copper-binding domain-containing protein n=1 Tax=Phytophthora fragariae TaxID=53985 RepID=A0A6A3F4L5_9STRA|nr:hypothetical protein PF003_g16859 [Phytophthora fragariae]KAE8938650.1 hypothetical protein PF009_g11468 [Phytophthora fragariae]KAE9116179.1 hypothetical protein PF007_g9752 [Phytophthora fragariae]KAE9145931.1 hypothetical protein PF006_g9262 [Phytophthora fragariae]KAE9213517.1 hypothetical protein PF005_g10175 [Phytophthora fragariae]
MAPRQAKSQLLALLVSISLLVTPTSANVWPTNGVCGSRVRYPWDSLTSTDKQLYRDAISTAMSTGYHALFVEVHSDLTSFREAHNTCGMMFWHRRYLLAYEEMLRSLGTRFACITIPYWDYFADYAKFLANTCTTFENCSTFLKDMGGSSGPSVSLSINGFTVNGNCVNGLSSSYADFTNFCEKSTMSGSACAGCIPRGSWSTANFPSGFCYSSLAKYLSLQYGYAWFSQNIHWGVHQSIHNTALGALVTYPTSADPVFYSHHATVDLIQQLYFDCQIGRVLSDSDKQTGAYAYQSCSVANYPNTPPTSLSTMTMFWNATGQTRIPVESHPRLGKFFAYQPKEYWHYVSATDMGNLSYSYASDDLFALLQSEGLSCPKSNTRKLFDASYVNVPMTASSKAKAIGRSYNLYQDIIDAASSNTSTQTDAIDQGETLDCLWYDENFGVDDFNAVFRENWKIPSSMHTVCYNRVQDIKDGRRQVKVNNWKDKYMFHYFQMTDAQLASASNITSTDETAMIGSGSAASTTPTTAPTTTTTTSTTATASTTPTTAPTTTSTTSTTSATTTP